MSVSAKVKAVMSLSNKNHSGLASYLGISTQALSNKFYRDSFSAADLIKVAECCGTALCFLSNDGNKVVIDTNDLKVAREATNEQLPR